MKKTVLALAIVITAGIIVGCGSNGSGTSYTAAQQEPSKQTTVYSGGGDVDISDVNVGDNATYIKNADGTVTYVGGNIGGDNQLTIDATHNGTGPDATSVAYDEANYDPSLGQKECNDLGFFYCAKEHKCLNRPAASGACPVK